MNFNKITEVSVSQIKKFVIQAKRETFAGTDKKVSMTNQGSLLSYRRFDDEEFPGMIYNDEYNGNTIEAGMETISVDLCNIWRNHYYGGSFIEHWAGADELHIISDAHIDYLPFITTEFLKTALLQLPLEFPVRGPHYFSAEEVHFKGNTFRGKWEYINEWTGIPLFDTDDPFAAFQGHETISCNGTTIYWHGYHGGFIRDKYFPIILKE